MLRRLCKQRFIVVVAACIAAPISHGQVLYQFDLPAQSLADSLRAVAAKSGTNILFDPRDVKDIKVAALHEQLTVGEAINRVLAGTRLGTESTTSTTVIIRPIITSRAATAPDHPR